MRLILASSRRYEKKGGNFYMLDGLKSIIRGDESAMRHAKQERAESHRTMQVVNHALLNDRER
jgi:hypothetical protein